VTKLLTWILIGYLVYKFFLSRNKSDELPATPEKAHNDTHQDPVCGVYVAEEDAVIGRLEGERLYFCSMACLEKFQQQLADKP
jgi:YHS domain-containing protein